jgi:ABC-type nitrate/sulfonate/bicarbonate transport system substrate-binding protein
MNDRRLQIFVFFFLIVVGGITIFLIKSFRQTPTPKKPPQLAIMTLAMDYTPNTNHTGVYVALAKGWYKKQGIDLKVLPYSASVSPDLLVATGKADVGISYTEGVVSDAASGNPVVSIAAIIQHNTSSLVALADSSIKRPKDFDGKIYGGFGAPYENAVVGEIIKKDGGRGNFKNVTLDIDGLKALQTGKINFAWIFDGWTGVQAKLDNIKLVSFPVNTNGIADYYTPVFIASQNEIKQKPDLLKKFMKATAQGYTYAIANATESAHMLINGVAKGTLPDTNFIVASQEYLSPRYVDDGRTWGLQDKQAWHDYPQFMLDSGAINDAQGKPVAKMDFDSLFTNQFIQ